MTKFDLIEKRTITETISSLDSTVKEAKSYGRNIRPSRKIEIWEDAEKYIHQLREARIYYGQLMEVPFTIEYPLSMSHVDYDRAVKFQDDTVLLFNEISRMGILGSKDRTKRYGLYEEWKKYGDSVLKSKKNLPKNDNFDAVAEGQLSDEMEEK